MFTLNHYKIFNAIIYKKKYVYQFKNILIY